MNGDDLSHQLVEHLPRLQSLQLLRVATLTSDGVLALAGLEQLRELDLSWCRNEQRRQKCANGARISIRKARLPGFNYYE